MTTLTSLLNDYMSKEEMLSLIDSYNDYKKFDKDQVLWTFFNYMNQAILPLINIKLPFPDICGSGTVGCVIAVETNGRFAFDDFEKQTEIPIYRVRKSKLCNANMPKKLALKVQILDSKDKYWEARILKEEFIQNKLSEYKTFEENIPKFYFGCTANMPYKDDIIRFRLTFMELIDTKIYKPLLSIIKLNRGLPDILYKNIENLAHNLWRHKISHNDLSVNNILVSEDNYNNIKLLDFGLSCILNRGLDHSNLVADYNKYFENLDKSEQNGSNVAKLNELFQYVKK